MLKVITKRVGAPWAVETFDEEVGKLEALQSVVDGFIEPMDSLFIQHDGSYPLDCYFMLCNETGLLDALPINFAIHLDGCWKTFGDVPGLPFDHYPVVGNVAVVRSSDEDYIGVEDGDLERFCALPFIIEKFKYPVVE